MEIIEERLEQLFWLSMVSEWLADMATGKVQVSWEEAVSGIKAIQYFAGLAINNTSEMLTERRRNYGNEFGYERASGKTE